MRKFKYALAYLKGLINYERWREREYEFKLEEYKEFLSKIENPNLSLKNVILIGGTKGKGSTAEMIAYILSKLGYKTGLYTSPHILDLRERIKINGRLIPKRDFADIVEQLIPSIETHSPKITYFEALTTIAFLYFLREGTQFNVFEVGLGGRLDATNTTQPEISVITKIGIDHTNILGRSKLMIAREKSYIMRPGKKVIIGKQDDNRITKFLLTQADKISAVPILYNRDFKGKIIEKSPFQTSFEYKGQGSKKIFTIKLPGEHQVENASVCLSVIENLLGEVNLDFIQSILKNFKIQGRIQIFSKEPFIILDMAHNLCSAVALRNYIKNFWMHKRTKKLLIGISRDKHKKAILKTLVPLFDEVIVTEAKNPRATPAQNLAKIIQEIGHPKVKVELDLVSGMDYILSNIKRDELLCATGSTYIVGDVLNYLSLRKRAKI